MDLNRFLISECVWTAFFRNLAGTKGPDTSIEHRGPRVLCLSLNPVSNGISQILSGSPSNLPEPESGVTPIYPHQGLSLSLPLAFSHLWMISTDMHVSYQALTNKQDFVYLNSDYTDVGQIMQAAQLSAEEFDFVLTGSTYPGPDINVSSGMRFKVQLWDVRTNEVLYHKDSSEDGLSMTQNVSHSATGMTNTIAGKFPINFAPDYVDCFEFWLRDMDLQILGMIASQLCSEYARAGGMITNLPRLDRWIETLSELSQMAKHYKRPELYKSYFMYLMCRIMMPGVSEDQRKEYQDVISSIPSALYNELSLFTDTLTRQFQTGE